MHALLCILAPGYSSPPKGDVDRSTILVPLGAVNVLHGDLFTVGLITFIAFSCVVFVVEFDRLTFTDGWGPFKVLRGGWVFDKTGGDGNGVDWLLTTIDGRWSVGPMLPLFVPKLAFEKRRSVRNGQTNNLVIAFYFFFVILSLFTLIH